MHPSSHRPKVTIVTACLNSERYIKETIESVLAQTYPNIEYIVIDGQSTDSTPEIIRHYAERLSYWVSEPDTGMYQAINKGIRRATGQIVAYLNSDDVYPAHAVEKAVETFASHPGADAIYGDLDYIDDKSRILRRYRYPAFSYTCFVCMGYSSIPQPAAFWLASVHERVGFFDETLRMAADFDFFARIGRSGKIIHVPDVLALHRRHGATLTHTGSDVNRREVELVRQRYVPSHLRILQPLLGLAGTLRMKRLNLGGR